MCHQGHKSWLNNQGNPIETKQEALTNLEDAKKGWIYSNLSGGESIPEPRMEQDSRDASGKILLRMPKELHYRIAQMAKANSISINQELLYLVSCALGEVSVSESLIGKLDDLKDLLRQSTGLKKNRDIGREYSLLIEELEPINREAKSVNSALYYDENPSVFEQSKKILIAAGSKGILRLLF